MDVPIRELLLRPAVEVAPRLLGWTFGTVLDDAVTTVRLTEVEAYMGADDPASHAFRGMTDRNAPMFSAPGVVYVYLSYGIHHCVNIVTGPAGIPHAVLLRGGVPIEGVDTMRRRRGRSDHVADGPGKLGQALGLTPADSGSEIDGQRIALEPGTPPRRIVATERIGITKATDRLWRFIDADVVPHRTG